MIEVLCDVLRGVTFYVSLGAAFLGLGWLMLPEFGRHDAFARTLTAVAGGGVVFAAVVILILLIAVRVR